MTNNEMHGLLERITAVTRDLWDASSVNVPSDPLEWNRKFRAAAMQLEGAAALIRQHASDHPSMEEKDKGPFGWRPPGVVVEALSDGVPESWTKNFREWVKGHKYEGQLPTPPSTHPDGFKVTRSFPSGFLDSM